MTKYIFLDELTSDVMFEAYGRDFRELLVNSAEALFSVICDREQVGTSAEMELEVSAEDQQELLHEWLSALLTQSEIRGLFLSRFTITLLEKRGPFRLRATAYGEPITPEKGHTVVKGITYYGLHLEKSQEVYLARVAMDI